jgi:hypothetical protein
MLLNPEPDPLNAFEVQEILWTAGSSFKVREKIAVNRTEPDRGKPNIDNVMRGRELRVIPSIAAVRPSKGTARAFSASKESEETKACFKPRNESHDPGCLSLVIRVLLTICLTTPSSSRTTALSTVLLCHTCNSYVVTRDRGFSLDSSTATR